MFCVRVSVSVSARKYQNATQKYWKRRQNIVTWTYVYCQVFVYTFGASSFVVVVVIVIVIVATVAAAAATAVAAVLSRSSVEYYDPKWKDKGRSTCGLNIVNDLLGSL